MAMAQLNRFLRKDDGYDIPAIDDTAELPVIAPEDDDTATLRPVVLADRRVSYGRQSAAALQHAWRVYRRRVRDEHERDGSWLHQRKTEQHSYQAVTDYAASRAWVPPGHDGGISEKLGVLYFVLGRLKTAYHVAQLYKAARPARWAVWNAFKFAVAMTLLTLDGHGRLAAEITGGVLLAAGLLCAALMSRRSEVGSSEGDADEEEDLS